MTIPNFGVNRKLIKLDEKIQNKALILQSGLNLKVENCILCYNVCRI